MFNEISRDKIFQVIQAHYPGLMPFVDMLYSEPGSVFYKIADGNWYSHLMEEGVNQGCPLSATLAALVLNEILAPLTAKLKARAHIRYCQNIGYDDEFGGESHPMGHIDDVGGISMHSSFKRLFTLPKEVTVSKVTAHTNNGVLTITAPKYEEVKENIRNSFYVPLHKHKNTKCLIAQIMSYLLHLYFST